LKAERRKPSGEDLSFVDLDFFPCESVKRTSSPLL
jgi:hypothetical protein